MCFDDYKVDIFGRPFGAISKPKPRKWSPQKRSPVIPKTLHSIWVYTYKYLDFRLVIQK